MRLLLLDKLEDRLAHGAEGVASVEDVEDDIRGVDDLVELAVDAAGGPLCVDGLEEVGVGLRLENFKGGSGRSLLGLRGSFVRGICELGERPNLDAGALALCFGTKGIGEGLSLDNVGALRWIS